MARKTNRFSFVFFVCLISLAAGISNMKPHSAAAAQNYSAAAQPQVDESLVTIQASALDKKANPVRNLKKEDFELYENGKKQEILDVDEILPEIGLPSGRSVTPQGKTVLILFDDRAITPQYSKISRDTAERFVSRNMRPQDIFGVAAYSLAMKIMQDFTSDRNAVLAAIRRPPDAASGGGSTQELLLSLNKINKAIAAVSGQKSILIYTQSGFTVPGDPDDNFHHGNLVGDIYRSVLKSATEANVIFHAVCPEALVSNAGANLGRSRYESVDPANVFTTPQRAEIQIMGSYVSVRALATESGGLAVYNTNNLISELDKLDQQLSNYYILTFKSTNKKREEGYRKLRIKTKAKGVTLKYQPGYQVQRPAERSSVRTETLLTSIEFAK